MGSVKYSKVKTSNGLITFTKDDNIIEFNCDNYEFLKIYNISLTPVNNNHYFKLYINNSTDYILLGRNSLSYDKDFTLKDFAINHVKIEYVVLNYVDYIDDYTSELQYYLCK